MNGKQKKKILVTGGVGLLGNAVVRQAKNTYETVYTYNRHARNLDGARGIPLDITSAGAVMECIAGLRPDLIVNAAALRTINYCQEHPDEAMAVNATGAGNIAAAAARYGAKMIHVSTDSVFDGQKGMYKETDPPNPVTVYGKSKLEGERLVMGACPEALIVRVSSIYGMSLEGQSIPEWVLDQLRKGIPVKMFTDAYLSPVFADNMAEVMLEAAGAGLKGIYNVSNERCSRYELGLETARVFGLDTALVQPVSSETGEVKMRVARARDASLDPTRIARAVKTPVLGLRDGLTRFKKLLDGGVKS